MKDIRRIIASWDGEILCMRRKQTRGENVLRRRGKSARLACAVCALLAVAISASSCSIIRINPGKFAAHVTAAATETGAATEPDIAPADTAPETEPPEPPKEYVYEGQKEAEAMLATVDYDFGGQSVFIRSTDEGGIGRLLAFSDEDTDAYSAARYERYRMVEEALNCRVNYTVTTLVEMKADIRAAAASDGYYADLLAVTGEEMTSLARDGLLLNLYSLPFFELDAPYFGESTAALAAGNDAYGVFSYATTDPDTIPCVFYDSAKIPKNVESEVRAGTWTWDRLIALAGEAGGPISLSRSVGDGGRARLAELAAASAGMKFVMNRRGEAPSAIFPEGFSDIVEVCRRVLTSCEVVESPAPEAFDKMEASFAVGTLGDMSALADSKVAWGVLPIPKTAAGEGGYRGLVAEPSFCFAVPSTTTDAPGASALLRAFAAASCGMIRDGYEAYHLYNTVRLESSADMIGYVFDSAYFDLAHVYASAGGLREATYGLLAEALAGANAQALFQQRRWEANRALSALFPIRG